MNAGMISATATGDQIAEIVDKIDMAVEGYPSSHVLMACIALTVVMQKPDITPDALERAIYDVSQYVVMLLGDAEDTSAN